MKHKQELLHDWKGQDDCNADLHLARLQTSRTLALLTATILAAHSFLGLSLSASPTEEPDEEITSAHFWTFTIGDATFGLREWRCSGNPTAGLPPRAHTTVFLGSAVFWTRLPASSLVVFGLCGSFVAATLLGTRRGPEIVEAGGQK